MTIYNDIIISRIQPFLPFQHFYFQKHRGNVDFLLTLGHQKNIEWRAKHNMFRLQRILDNYNAAKD